ncbi:MAG: hypothetical protein J6K45_05000 [Clostridia bacterium]|nr:hypothetical protein [Clostridia bacterium]
MSKISENYAFYRDRKIEKKTKYKGNDHLNNKNKEKLYDYYTCDYCKDEIVILPKRENMTGGIVTIPYSLTGRGPIELMLCQKCLNPVLNEFEEARSGDNHIPRMD